MKVYTRIVLDMGSGCVLEEESYEYSGPVAECKGGGGGTSTTTTVDKEYNARMAAIAEDQQAMAQEYFDFWQSDYQPMEREQIAANRELIPMQTQLEQQKISSALELMPKQTQLAGMQLDNQLELNPLKLDLEKQMLSGTSSIAGKYFDQAANGVNVADRMGKASAGVAQQFKDANQSLARQMGRMGMNPASGAGLANMQNMRMGQAKAAALGRESARAQAENENFTRLSSAMGMGMGMGFGGSQQGQN